MAIDKIKRINIIRQKRKRDKNKEKGKDKDKDKEKEKEKTENRARSRADPRSCTGACGWTGSKKPVRNCALGRSQGEGRLGRMAC
jgi:hypothetical protein